MILITLCITFNQHNIGVNKMFTRQELEAEQEVENFKFNLSKITDENINKAFEVFTKEEIVIKLLADELWFKLSDRAVSLDSLEEELSKNNEAMLEVIRDGSTVPAELEKLAYTEVDEIINSYDIGA